MNIHVHEHLYSTSKIFFDLGPRFHVRSLQIMLQRQLDVPEVITTSRHQRGRFLNITYE